MKKRILFVDGEQQILSALKRLFFRSEYATYYAKSGSEALNIMSEHRIDMVITDIRMPQMDGYTLLEEIKKKYPLTIRIALSGYADRIRIFKALDQNLIKIYLFKPWDNNEIKEMIKKLFELEHDLNNENLLNLINNINKLPTIPRLYKDINKLIENQTDMGLIAKKIEEDQSISAKILRISNSAFYRNKTGSIKEAITYIGLSNVKNIVLVNSVLEQTTKNHIQIENLWKHAIFTNKILHLIYRKYLNKRIPTFVQTAGLLHDLGKVIFYEYFTEDYLNIQFLSEKNSEINIMENEKEFLGVTHEEIGAFLLDWWGLPLGVVESVLYHHRPLDQRVINKELVCVMHLANYYSKKIFKDDASNIELQMQVFDYLDIKADLLDRCIDQYITY